MYPVLSYCIPTVQVILLSSLKEPVPRPIYDQVVRSSLMEPLLECLHNRRLLRQNLCRHDREPVYPEVSDNLATLIRKLTSQGMTTDVEEQLVVSFLYLSQLMIYNLQSK